MLAIANDTAPQHVGHEGIFYGWLQRRRDSGKVRFLTVRRGTEDTQAVLGKKAVRDEQFAVLTSLIQESSLVVTGQLRQDDRSPGGYVVSRIETLPFPRMLYQLCP